MTTNNPAPGNNPGLPTIAECQHNAVILSSLIDGIDKMGNEGPAFDCPRVSLTIVALKLAKELAADLDRVAQ